MIMYCFRTAVMYTAMKGQNDRLKLLLDNGANMDLQTTAPGPLIDFKVPRKYTTQDLNADGEDTFIKGFT